MTNTCKVDPRQPSLPLELHLQGHVGRRWHLHRRRRQVRAGHIVVGQKGGGNGCSCEVGGSGGQPARGCWAWPWSSPAAAGDNASPVQVGRPSSCLRVESGERDGAAHRRRNPAMRRRAGRDVSLSDGPVAVLPEPKPTRDIPGALLPDELTAWVTAAGAPKYRADEIFRWLHGQGIASARRSTNVPSARGSRG